MCTVTILRAGDALRVACNRDERRARPGAHPPFITRARGIEILTPHDPQGGGTWIAATSSGLVFALLNGNPSGYVEPSAVRSRGAVIPLLADAQTIVEVAFRIADLPAREFAPFRVVVSDLSESAEFVFGDEGWHATAYRTADPLLFTSSSLGDSLVQGPRRMLFDQMLGGTGRSTLFGGDLARRQDAFHRHRWRDRPALSVHMSRPDACTVSTTTVEATRSQVRMLYEPAHDAVGTPVGLVIDRDDIAAASRSRRQYAAV